MTAPVLADALGPRARRRVLVASVLSGALLVLLAVIAVRRFADQGELDADQWRLLTEWSVIRFLLGGLMITLRVALVSMALALVLGVLLALGRLARNAPMRWGTGLFVEFFRGLPVILLILFCYTGLPRLGLDLPSFWYLVMGLVAYNSAVLAEIFRAGILSLDRGQSEAASAIGLSYWQGMRIVLIPQAARRMTPALVSQLVTLLKDTALGFIIGFEELLRRANISGIFGNNLLQSYMAAAVLYIVVNFTLSRLARRLEVRQRRRLGAGTIDVSGVEDLAVVQAQGTGALTD
jgi:glutamate transport system permease protein